MSDLDSITQRVEAFLDELTEHFAIDSIRVFITKPSDDTCQNTTTYSEGRGNLYAQLGQISEWVIMQDEEARMRQRKEEEE